MDDFLSRRVCIRPSFFLSFLADLPWLPPFINVLVSETPSPICRPMEAAVQVPMAPRLPLHLRYPVILVHSGNRPVSASTCSGRRNSLSSAMLSKYLSVDADLILPSSLFSQLNSCRKVVPACSTLERPYELLTGVLSTQTRKGYLHLVQGSLLTSHVEPDCSYRYYLAVAPLPSRTHTPEIGVKVPRPSRACVQL
jgi:hypothetical protein